MGSGTLPYWVCAPTPIIIHLILHVIKSTSAPVPLNNAFHHIRQKCLHIMADFDLSESGVTINSDSEQYSAQDELSPPSPASESSPPLILYQPPSIWGLIRGAAINVLLPFVNGLMLGFGELFAHEAAFRLGWGGTKVCISDFSHSSVIRGKGSFKCGRRACSGT